jgi:fatty-acid desaturase
MSKLFSFLGSTIVGYAGWFLGAKIGITTAFMLSMVGTGIGIYYGRLIARNYGA